jgi:hypothetical protein
VLPLVEVVGEECELLGVRCGAIPVFLERCSALFKRADLLLKARGSGVLSARGGLGLVPGRRLLR